MGTGLPSRFIFIFLLLACSSPAYAKPSLGEVRIHTANARFIFISEIVEKPEDLADGLMFRENLAEDTGMFFIFGQEKIANMWMKNTLLSLDMIFIDGDGTIVKIAKNATPHSEAVISSGVPVRAVFEINGGMCDKLGIKEGDTVYHDIFAR